MSGVDHINRNTQANDLRNRPGAIEGFPSDQETRRGSLDGSNINESGRGTTGTQGQTQDRHFDAELLIQYQRFQATEAGYGAGQGSGSAVEVISQNDRTDLGSQDGALGLPQNQYEFELRQSQEISDAQFAGTDDASQSQDIHDIGIDPGNEVRGENFAHDFEVASAHAEGSYQFAEPVAQSHASQEAQSYLRYMDSTIFLRA